MNKYPSVLSRDFINLGSYMACASWVASRDFGVDERDMVPLADIFNHKAAVVALEGHELTEAAAGAAAGAVAAGAAAGGLRLEIGICDEENEQASFWRRPAAPL